MSSPFLPGCPWYDLHSKFPPNVDWCEEKLCSFIIAPFNTWSNLAYIFIAFLIWRKSRSSKSSLLRFFAPAAVWVGLTSLIYHLSLNAFTQVFDFFGMYIFCVLMMMSNLSRMGKWGIGKKGKQQFWISVVTLTALTTIGSIYHFPVQLFVLLLIIAIIRTELIQKVETRKYFWFSVLALFIAAILSALDVSRVLCWPENHWFQGHGTWHIINSLSLYFAYMHASQFEK